MDARPIRLLDSAIAVDRAMGGMVQIYRASDRTLRLACHRGLPEAFVDLFKIVREGDGTACSHAMFERRRICIRDILTDTLLEVDREFVTGLGIRSVQSTPVHSPAGQFLGVLSTYWRAPHHPGAASCRALDELTGRLGAVLEAAVLTGSG